MAEDIIDTIRSALLNKSDVTKYSWEHIRSLQHKQKVGKLQVATATLEELREWYDTFNDENTRLASELQEAKQAGVKLYEENQRLAAILEGYQTSTSDRTIGKIVKRRIPGALTPSTGSIRMGEGYMVMMADPSYVHRVDIPLFSVIKPFRDIHISRYSSPPLRPHAEKIKELYDARDRRLEQDPATDG